MWFVMSLYGNYLPKFSFDFIDRWGIWVTRHHAVPQINPPQIPLSSLSNLSSKLLPIIHSLSTLACFIFLKLMFDNGSWTTSHISQMEIYSMICFLPYSAAVLLYAFGSSWTWILVLVQRNLTHSSSFFLFKFFHSSGFLSPDHL